MCKSVFFQARQTAQRSKHRALCARNKAAAGVRMGLVWGWVAVMLLSLPAGFAGIQGQQHDGWFTAFKGDVERSSYFSDDMTFAVLYVVRSNHLIGLSPFPDCIPHTHRASAPGNETLVPLNRATDRLAKPLRALLRLTLTRGTNAGQHRPFHCYV